LNAENVFINIFKNYERVSNDEFNFSTQYIKHIDSQDINLSSFLSNINFVDHLCNICIILESMPLKSQHRTLLNELNKVNKNIPSNTYIPFLRDSIRNYVVCHIPISEAKIYKTKNRSPYMITLECIRLEEIN
jgi:phosphatidylinositol 4-kinase